jgi:hypothetical protein
VDLEWLYEVLLWSLDLIRLCGFILDTRKCNDWIL